MLLFSHIGCLTFNLQAVVWERLGNIQCHIVHAEMNYVSHPHSPNQHIYDDMTHANSFLILLESPNLRQLCFLYNYGYITSCHGL